MHSKAAGFLVAVALLAVSAGCALVDDWGSGSDRPAPAPAAPTLTPEAQATLETLSLLHRLAEASATEQAEIVEETRRAASASPTFTNQLRQALVLGMPDHAGSDPVAARASLGVLLARPDGLLPAELDLAYVALQDINARLALASENRRLKTEADRGDNDRQGLNRKLQAASAENARLKQDLDAALAKLEAVADLERSLAERQSQPKGPPP